MNIQFSSIAVLLFTLFLVNCIEAETDYEAVIDLSSDITKIAEKASLSAKAFPGIAEIYRTEDTVDLRIFEQFTKDAVVQKLLNQLLEVWAKLNADTQKGLRVANELRQEAIELVAQLQNKGQQDIMSDELYLKLLERRIKQLISNYKTQMCANDGTARGPLQMDHFIKYEQQLGYVSLKSKLIDSLPQKKPSWKSKRDTSSDFDSIYRMLWAIEFVTEMLKELQESLDTLKNSASEQLMYSVQRSDLITEEISYEIDNVIRLWKVVKRRNNLSFINSLKMNSKICVGQIPVY